MELPQSSTAASQRPVGGHIVRLALVTSSFSLLLSAAFVLSVHHAYDISMRVNRVHAFAPEGAPSATLFFDVDLEHPSWTPHRVQFHSAKCRMSTSGVETLAEVPRIRYAGSARISFPAQVRAAPVGTWAAGPECEIASSVDLFGSGLLLPRTVRKPLTQEPPKRPDMWLERTGPLTRTSSPSVQDPTVALEQATLLWAHVPAGSLSASWYDFLGGAEISLATSITYVEGDEHSIRVTKTVNSNLKVESDGHGGYQISLPVNVTGHLHPRRAAGTLGNMLMGRSQPYESSPPVKPGHIDRSVRFVAAQPESLAAHLLGRSHSCGWRTHKDSLPNKLFNLVPKWAAKKMARNMVNASVIGEEDLSLMHEGRRLLMDLPDMQVIFQEGFYWDSYNMETEFLAEMTDDEIRVTQVINGDYTDPMYDAYDHGTETKFLMNPKDGLMKFESFKGDMTYANVTLNMQPSELAPKMINVLVNDVYSGESVLEFVVQPDSDGVMAITGKAGGMHDVLTLNATGSMTEDGGFDSEFTIAEMNEGAVVQHLVGVVGINEAGVIMSVELFEGDKEDPEVIVKGTGALNEEGLTFDQVEVLGPNDAPVGKLEPVVITFSPPSFKTTAYTGQDEEIVKVSGGIEDGTLSGVFAMSEGLIEMWGQPNVPCLEGTCTLTASIDPMLLTIESTPAGEGCSDTAPAGVTGNWTWDGCADYDWFVNMYEDACTYGTAGAWDMYPADDDSDFTVAEMCCVCGGGKVGGHEPTYVLNIEGTHGVSNGMSDFHFDASLMAHGMTAFGLKIVETFNREDYSFMESVSLVHADQTLFSVNSTMEPIDGDTLGFNADGVLQPGPGSGLKWSLDGQLGRVGRSTFEGSLSTMDWRGEIDVCEVSLGMAEDGLTMDFSVADGMEAPFVPCLEGSCSLKMTTYPTKQMTFASYAPEKDTCDDTAPPGATGSATQMGCANYDFYFDWYGPSVCSWGTDGVYGMSEYGSDDDEDFTLTDMCCVCGGGVKVGEPHPSILLNMTEDHALDGSKASQSMDVSLMAHGMTVGAITTEVAFDFETWSTSQSMTLVCDGVTVFEMSEVVTPGDVPGHYDTKSDGAMMSFDGHHSKLGWSLNVHEAGIASTMDGKLLGPDDVSLGEVFLDSAGGVQTAQITVGPMSYSLQINTAAARDQVVLSDADGDIGTLSYGVDQTAKGPKLFVGVNKMRGDPLPASGLSVQLAAEDPQASVDILDPANASLASLSLGYTFDEMPIKLGSNWNIGATFTQGVPLVPAGDMDLSIGCQSSGGPGVFAASATVGEFQVMDLSGDCGFTGITATGTMMMTTAIKLVISKADMLLDGEGAMDFGLDMKALDDSFASKYTMFYDGVASFRETTDIKAGNKPMASSYFEISNGQWVAGKNWVGEEAEAIIEEDEKEIEGAITAEEDFWNDQLNDLATNTAGSPSPSLEIEAGEITLPSRRMLSSARPESEPQELPGFLYSSFNFTLTQVDGKMWSQSYEESKYRVDSTNYSLQLPDYLHKFDFDVETIGLINKKYEWWSPSENDEWVLEHSANFSIQQKKFQDSEDFLSEVVADMGDEELPPFAAQFKVSSSAKDALASPTGMTAFGLVAFLGAGVICAVLITKWKRRQGTTDVEQTQLLETEEP